MISIGNILISEDILEKQFVCDLERCRGACCVEGESGAPLEEEEKAILDDIYHKVEPYLHRDGIRAVKKYGRYMTDSDGDLVTPLMNGTGACAYTIFADGVAHCAIEKAFEDKVIKYHKPISCHIYPIRVSKLKSGVEALNYHRWDLCKAACTLGKKLAVPIYSFLKTPLIRKYGRKFYTELEIAASLVEKEKSGGQ